MKPKFNAEDYERAAQLRLSITEGELLIQCGRMTNGAKMTPEYLAMTKRAVENSKAKLQVLSPNRAS